MVRIAHLADVHLGSAFAWTGAEDKARRFRRQQLDGLNFCLQTAREKDCAAVLIAGDLFDSAFAERESVARFIYLAGQYASLPILIAAGNHDPLSEGGVYLRGNLPENVHVFPAAGDYVEIGDKLRVHGVSAVSARDNRAPLEQLRALKDGRFELALIHAELASSAAAAHYAPVTRAQLGASGFAYVAMGHIHERSGLQYEAGTAYAYAGALQGRGFDECGEKGFYLVELEQSRVHTAFIPVAGSRFEIVKADLSEVHDYEGALACYEKALAGFAPQDQVRVILSGRIQAADSEWPALLMRLADQNSRYIRDETVIVPDPDRRAEDTGVRGLVVAALEEKMAAAADERQREVYSRALRYALLAMDGEKVAPYED